MGEALERARKVKSRDFISHLDGNKAVIFRLDFPLGFEIGGFLDDSSPLLPEAPEFSDSLFRFTLHASHFADIDTI